jgi:hypothetical protein
MIVAVFCDGIHLVSSSLDELHKFAKSVKLKSEWFQDKRKPHYDVSGIYLKLARINGVVFLSKKDLIKRAKSEKWEGWEF